MEEINPQLREAIAWVVRLHSGEATTDDLEAIKQWRNLSPENEEAFRQAVRLWRKLGVAAKEIKNTEQPATNVQSMPSRRSTRRAFLGGALAAGVAGAAYSVFDPPMDLWPSYDELAADYRTGKGETKVLSPAGGVALTLSTLTSVSLLYTTGNDTGIELIAGEAVVTTHRAPDRPFVLHVKNGRVVATESKFNTRCTDGVVKVTCLEGTVDVDVKLGVSAIQLKSGQQVTFSPEHGLGTIADVDPQQATAWERGLLIVQDRPLAEVVEEVNRYRPGRIVVTNQALGSRMVNGTFHIDRLEDFAGQVRQLFGVSVHTMPGGIIFLS